jgi:hypothetical protein
MIRNSKQVAQCLRSTKSVWIVGDYTYLLSYYDNGKVFKIGNTDETEKEKPIALSFSQIKDLLRMRNGFENGYDGCNDYLN